jgi:release factor glutamine methyltransferase
VELKQALSSAVAILASHEVPSPRMNAELLLRFVLGCDRAYLFAHPERQLTADEEHSYSAVLAERSRGVPAQYITGHQEFWGMDFLVAPAVLIPRPETEHIIETVLAILSTGPGSPTSVKAALPPGDGGPKVRIADVGTGSGCIALALAKELPDAELYATDISLAALEIARANAARLQLEGRVRFHQADLLTGVDPPFDFVVSNPPYVGESEKDQVQLEVRKFEPRSAVFAGANGTEVIARLIPEARAFLRPGGWLILEISGSIVDQVHQMLIGWDDVKLISDLQSIPRVIRARRPRS